MLLLPLLHHHAHRRARIPGMAIKIPTDHLAILTPRVVSICRGMNTDKTLTTFQEFNKAILQAASLLQALLSAAQDSSYSTRPLPA